MEDISVSTEKTYLTLEIEIYFSAQQKKRKKKNIFTGIHLLVSTITYTATIINLAAKRHSRLHHLFQISLDEWIMPLPAANNSSPSIIHATALHRVRDLF